jgi:nitrite reductase/ring-hydroxylating ferredoxin subunit
VDLQSLEYSLVRRLLDHVENGTTDMDEQVMEVPAEFYWSPERYAEELDVLFLDQPLVLCLSGLLPSANSYRTIDVCDTPLLLTRDENGKIHLLANTCRHRGVRVADGCGEARKLTCPFHAWSYDIKGNLVAIPFADGFEGMCREDKGLVELPVAEKHGLVVGRLRPGPAVDVDAYLGPELAEELSWLELEKWEPFTEMHIHMVKSNWKVALDTFRENYHFAHLHRNTLKGTHHPFVLTFDAFGRHLRNSTGYLTIDTLKDKPESEWGDVMPHITLQYALFPNTPLAVGKHCEFWQVFPVDPKTSAIFHTAYAPPALPQAERDRIADFTKWICDTVVDGEDFWVAGRTEPGIRTGLLDKMVIGKNEPAIQHLHRGFDAALHEARATS